MNMKAGKRLFLGFSFQARLCNRDRMVSDWHSARMFKQEVVVYLAEVVSQAFFRKSDPDCLEYLKL